MKTKIKMLRPGQVWQPKRGAPRGNRNAQKHGAYAREAMALRRQVTAWKRMTKVLMKGAKEQLALRKG